MDAQTAPSPINHYFVSWGCAAIAVFLAWALLRGVVVNWGERIPMPTIAGRAGTLTATIMVWSVPMFFSQVALAGSEGRPRGRIGFFSLILTAIGFLASLATLMTSWLR